jgi:hypothetical protein
MDDTIVAVYANLTIQYGCSVDDILETPKFREQFLQATRHRLGDLPERELLHRLVYLRKCSRLPRSRPD